MAKEKKLPQVGELWRHKVFGDIVCMAEAESNGAWTIVKFHRLDHPQQLYRLIWQFAAENMSKRKKQPV